MKDLRGKKVRMKTNNARWYLSHLQIYTNGITWDKSIKTETLIHALCVAGYEIEGKVIRAGNCGSWLVKWQYGPFTAKYFVERKHFEVI